jgi:hypothetical protein
MTWLFLILILSTLAVVCAGAAIYLRIRKHMKPSEKLKKELEKLGSQHEAENLR